MSLGPNETIGCFVAESVDPVALGLGSNLGDRLSNLRGVISRLAERDGIEITGVSSVYETDPIGPAQPDYLNAALTLRTSFSPFGLLVTTQEIERDLGRRPGPRWGPRIIDVDVLFWGDRRIRNTDLVVPHPELLRRGFALMPLFEIAPEWIHPDTGRTLEADVRSVKGQSRVMPVGECDLLWNRGTMRCS